MRKTVIDFASERDENGNIQAVSVDLTEEEIQARQAEEAADGTDAERAMRLLRQQRNRKLVETDWTQGADVPDTIKNAYTSYRQALRDITKTHNNPRTVVWPDKP
jgi:predicted DNA-binding ArsR family transcriptional regulator